MSKPQRAEAPGPWFQPAGQDTAQHPARAEPSLAAVDLNLLVALEALLRFRNVTHAGNHVGLSQPAMSRALSRLRHMFSDDVLVRTSSGLIPTPRAERLAETLPPILEQLRSLMATRGFTPGACRARLTIAMPDHQAFVLLPRLLPRLRERAPNLDVVTDPCLAGSLKRLEAGELDYAVGQLVNAPSGFYGRKLYEDRFVCVLREGHPSLSAPWTPERFVSARHAIIAPGNEDGFGQVHDSLAKLELPARDPVIVPNLMTAPMMIAETELVLTVPRRVAQRLATMLPLRVMDVPIELPPYEVSLIWHERSQRDEPHRWLRTEIAAAAIAAA